MKIEEVNQFIELGNKIKALSNEGVLKLLEDYLKETIPNTYPPLTAIGYTPSFNDGDPCYYSINVEERFDDEGEGEDYMYNSPEYKLAQEVIDNVESVFEKLGDAKFFYSPSAGTLTYEYYEGDY